MIWLELGGALEALVSHDDRCDPCFFLRRSAYYIKHHLKKILSSFWRTPYLVTKLRIKSEHFSANPNQSYLTPMTTFHHPKGMQLFNVVHISSKDWRKRVTHCAQDGRWWQMASSKALRGPPVDAAGAAGGEVGCISSSILVKSGHVYTCLGNTCFHGRCILKLLWYIWYFKYPS